MEAVSSGSFAAETRRLVEYKTAMIKTAMKAAPLIPQIT
jgi:hypothetical protein